MGTLGYRPTFATGDATYALRCRAAWAVLDETGSDAVIGRLLE